MERSDLPPAAAGAPPLALRLVSCCCCFMFSLFLLIVSVGSSSGRSFTAAVFDVSSVNTREATLYDASKRDEVVKDSTTSICDSPKPVVGLATPSIYDSPTNKPVPGLLPDIEETRPNYEIMIDQPNQLPPASKVSCAVVCCHH